jgi:hypothetical protein
MIMIKHQPSTVWGKTSGVLRTIIPLSQITSGTSLVSLQASYKVDHSDSDSHDRDCNTVDAEVDDTMERPRPMADGSNGDICRQCRVMFSFYSFSHPSLHLSRLTSPTCSADPEQGEPDARQPLCRRIMPDQSPRIRVIDLVVPASSRP